MTTTYFSLENYSEKCYKINGQFVPKSVVVILSESELDVADWFFKKNSSIFNRPAECTIELFNEVLNRFDGEIRKTTEKAILVALTGLRGTFEAWFPNSIIISLENNVLKYNGSFSPEWKKSSREVF